MQSVSVINQFRSLSVGSGLPRLMTQEYLYPGPCTQLQFVRWRKGRKPSYLGIAKTKKFIVRQRTEWPDVEEKEYSRLRRQWYTYVRSLWFFQQNLTRTKEEESRAHAKEISEDGEIEKLIEDIERDNAWVKANREEALVKERLELANQIAQERERLELIKLEKEEQVKADVEFKIKKLQSALTEETLELAVEQAIENPVDFNFAIDKTGNIYFGRRG